MIENLKRIIAYSIVMSLTLVWIGCSDDEPVDEIDDTNYLTGVFIDSPVEGLTYVTSDTTGQTDENGTFVYAENENAIEFKLGELSLGIVSINETITPLDFGGSNATIYTPIVNNIAALLQSLDSDGDPSNGITIEEAVSEQFQENSINLISENYAIELLDMINAINEELSTNLSFVHPNDAAKHLASSLNLEGQLKLRPTVKVGRHWENGLYFAYNTVGYNDPEREYSFNIIDDSVVYNFGQGTAYLMNFEFTQDTLFGIGNLYNNIDTDPTSFYEYSNRKTSPGFIVDHNDTTFIGYYNYRKISGNVGEIEGEYESFIVFDRKLIDGDVIKILVRQNILEIEEPNEDDSLRFIVNDLVSESTIETMIHKSLIEDESIFLVQLGGSEILFTDRQSGFYPGLISFKKE